MGKVVPRCLLLLEGCSHRPVEPSPVFHVTWLAEMYARALKRLRSQRPTLGASEQPAWESMGAAGRRGCP
jgi:hypothetical protein